MMNDEDRHHRRYYNRITMALPFRIPDGYFNTVVVVIITINRYSALMI